MTRRAIVLAAGQGKRMRSDLPKVLHPICGRPMLWHVVAGLRAAGVEDVTIVASPELAGRAELAALAPSRVVVQEPARGTGDAARVALAAAPPAPGGVVVIANGDMPLLDAELYAALCAALDGPAGAREAAMAVATARMGPRSQFGRVARDAAGDVARIVEARDATPAELALEEMNAGVYAFDEDALRAALPSLRAENAQGEYYLTDALALVRRAGRAVRAVAVDDVERVLGVNDRVELARAREALNRRLCEARMREGATIVDPASTSLEPDVEIGRDAVIEPGTTLAAGTRVGAGARIGPRSRVVASTIGAGAVVTESVVVESVVGAGTTVGPFAHLRQGSVVGEGARIGNFVEVKASALADGVRAGHLSYLGDAEVGAGVNVGAGAITCNYDGRRKSRTTIGAGAFVGSNASLIAPVRVGAGALVGAGAVVTKDVPEGARVAGNPARPLVARPEAAAVGATGRADGAGAAGG